MDLKNLIRDIPDYPKKGILFRDITTLLKDKDAFCYAIREMAKDFKEKGIELVVGPEARGFAMGAPVAYELGAGFVPVRKPGKLPAETIRYEYELEYGTDALEIHKDAIKAGQKVLVVDDLLATGGTISATIKLVEKLGGKVEGVAFLIELTSLKGRELLENQGYYVKSLIQY